MSRPRSSADDRPRHLIYGEGPSDVAFLKYLKSVFASRGTGFEIRADGDEGGDPVHVLRKCLNYRGGTEYSTRTILMDTDLLWHPTDVVERAAKAGISLLPSTPCLEGLLLAILDQRIPGSSRECKREIHQNWIPENLMLTPAAYEKHFPEPHLRARASAVPVLGALIQLMEHGKPPQ